MTSLASRVSEVRYRRLFEAAHDGILILDAGTGEILDVNPFMVALLGYAREEYLGKSLWEIGVFKDIAASKAAFAELQERRSIRYDNLPLQTKDGRVAEVEFVSNVYSENDHSVIQCNIRDITERRATESKLIEAQKMEAIGQLTGGLAHDFNNLLLVVIGNLGLLLEDRAGDQVVQEYGREALDAARRGAELTRSLLAFARRQPLRPERVDVNELAESIAKLLRRTLGERIEITLALAPDIWPVMVDPAQLQSSIANLATNARDAMPKGGQLVIATANRRLDAAYAAEHADVTEGDYAMLKVSDTGSGMPPEIVARIFDPFFTTKSRGEGTGLGLSMVFGFVKQSGGHVNVSSEPGAGTIFRLYLPRDAQVTERATPAPAVATASGRGETILVAEDDAAIRRLVVRQLNTAGYRVEQAANATDALHILENGRGIDLLFTDVVMAGAIDGNELAQAVIERWPSTRVVLTSGFPSADIAHDDPLPGGIRLLSKPYSWSDLERVVRDALDGGDPG